MKILKATFFFALMTMMLALAGCGGGGGGTAGNATLVMTLSASSIAAGGSISSEAKLTATGTHPVNELPITFTSSRPDLIHFAKETATNTGNSTISIETNLSGAVYVVINVDNTVAIPLEGVDVSITASAEGLTSTQQLKVTALTGSGTTPVGGTSVQLALSKAAIQDNGEQSIATATVRDAAGTPLAGQTVAFTISPTSGPAVAVPISGGVTDSSGRAFATITGTTTTLAQTVFVYATTAGVSTAQPLTINPTTISTPTSNPKNIAMAFGKTILQASEQTLLTATVTDGTNQPINNQTVNFSILPAGLHTVTPINGGLTDSAGKAYAIITAGIVSSRANVIVYASAGVSPNSVTSSSPIEILPPGGATATLPPAKVLMISDKASIQPGGQAKLTATVTDSAGAVVSNETVTFSPISGVTLLTPANVATSSDGTVMAVVAASASTTPTYALIRATTSNGVSQTISLGILPVGTPQISLAIAKQTIEATDKEVLATVTVLDSTGTPVNGQVVTFASISGPFTVAPTSVITGVDGRAITKLTPTATAFASNILLSMQMNYAGVDYSLVATALVNPAINLTVALDSATVDTVGQIIATATATTAGGTPLPSQVVTFDITGPGTIVGQSTTTAGDGTAKAVITHDGTANFGNIIVEASILYDGTVYRAYATAIPKAANMLLKLEVLSGFPGVPGVGSVSGSNTATVDALTSSLPVRATFTYIDGTPVPNQLVTFTALDPGIFWNTSGPAVPNGGSVSVSTSVSGEANAVAVPGNFPTSDYVHIQASVVINGATYTQVIPIKVMGAVGGSSSTQIQKSLTLDKTSITIAPAATGNVGALYNLKNSTGDPVSGQNVTFSILSGPATINGGATANVTTDGNGDADALISAGPNITSTTEVYVNAAVTIGGINYNSVATFIVKPSISLELQTDLDRIDQTIGVVTATATLKDSDGNPIVGRTVSFDILTGNAAISPASIITSADGTAKATITPGSADSTQNILVRVQTTVGTVTYQQVTTIQIVRGTGILTLSTIDNSSASIAADITSNTFLHQIPFTLTDSNGNPRPNVSVLLTIESQIGGTVVIANPTIITDAAGKGVFNLSVNVPVATQGGLEVASVVYKATTADGIIAFGGEQYSVSRELSKPTLSPSSVSFTGSGVGATRTISVFQGVSPYTVSSTNATHVTAAIAGSTVTLTLQSTNWTGSETITVTDAKGQTATATALFEPPILQSSPGSVSFGPADAVGTSITTTISGGLPGYSAVSGSPTVVSASISGSTLTITKLANVIGTVNITINDSNGKNITVPVGIN